MPNASPPPATTASPSKSRFHTCNNSNQNLQKMSVLNSKILPPPKGKRTRDLPNLSDCHGCSVRINYSNPKERLQLLKSFWRIVLLCSKCIKMVNSGQLCPYCFKDAVNSVSDCVKCSDCERLIHQNCIVKYRGSPPWSYSCLESGLGFSVCVDCWVPKSLKNSVRVCRRKEITENSGEEFSANLCDSRVSTKGKDGAKPIQEVVNDANSAVGKKFSVAVKAKEKALRRAVVAKNAVMVASNALNLVAEECSSKMSEGLVATINNGGCVNDVSKFVNDSELAFYLHRVMNSSPRISKNTHSTNLSCSDLLKLTESCTVSPKLDDLGTGEDGKVAVCSNILTNDNNDSNIMEASACIRTNESCSAVKSHSLKPELRTYMRKNKRRKDFQETVENDCVDTSFGVAGKCTTGDGSKIVTEPQSCQLDELKQVCQVIDARTSSPESWYTNIVTESRSLNRRLDRYAIKYKRMAAYRTGLHEEANLDSVSFQKEAHASDPVLPMDCSIECRELSDSSLCSSVVNLQARASIGVSSGEEG